MYTKTNKQLINYPKLTIKKKKSYITQKFCYQCLENNSFKIKNMK